jgi:hypothetical protein
MVATASMPSVIPVPLKLPAVTSKDCVVFVP